MRAISNKQFLEARFEAADFSGPWLEAIGRPDLRGTWIIYGRSGSGKTTFCLQLAKYLTEFDRVAYNSLEQGESSSLQIAWRRVGMHEVGSRIVLLPKFSLKELKEYLCKRKSPRIIFIDSVQYLLGFKLSDKIALNDMFPDKLFIYVSHEKNNEPDGVIAQKIKYDADVKIRCEAYMALVNTRYADSNSPYVIWKEGAEKFWKDKNDLNHETDNNG